MSLLWPENRSVRLFHDVSYYTIFFKIVGGFFFMISMYALIITKGNTSLLPVPFLSLALLRFKNQQRRMIHIQKINWKNILLFLLIALFLYWFYMVLHFTSSDNMYINYLGGDISFYARAGEWLNLSGKENVTPDPLGFSGITKEPYHYGDIWGIALLQKITGLHPLMVTTLMLYPACLSIFVFGLWSWVNARFNIKTNLPIFLVLLGGFTSGIKLLFPSFLISGFSSAIPVIYYPKLSFASILIIAISNSVYAKEWRHTILLLSLSCLLYISIAPPVLFTAFLFYFFSRFTKSGSAYGSVLPDSILFLLSLVYYLFFYGASPQTAIADFSLKIVVNILAGVVLQLIPLIPFFVLLIFYVIKKKLPADNIKSLSPDLIFLIMLPGAGLISWAIFYWMTPESLQFFSNVFIPVQSVLIVFIVLQALYSGSKAIRITGLILFAVSIFLNVRKNPESVSVLSSDFFASKQFLFKHGVGLFANFRDTAEIKNFDRNTIVYPPLSYLYYVQENYTNISMNTHQLIPDSGRVYSNMEKQTFERSPFKAFIDQQASVKSFEEYAYLFIKEYKVRYITVSPNTALPYNLVPMIIDSLSLSTGWKIYYLEQKQIEK